MNERMNQSIEKKSLGSFWTRTKAFKKLCQKAFKACDTSNSGRLSKEELYSGLLLVYINIAKYAGPAACYPPSRKVVNDLFDACDENESGDICEQEFVSIIIILSSQMTWRIATYYLFLILMLPYVIDLLISMLCWLRLDDLVDGMHENFESYAPEIFISLKNLVPDSLWGQLPESIVGFAIFSMIPLCWDMMDKYLYNVAEEMEVEAEHSKND